MTTLLQRVIRGILEENLPSGNLGELIDDHEIKAYGTPEKKALAMRNIRKFWDFATQDPVGIASFAASDDESRKRTITQIGKKIGIPRIVIDMFLYDSDLSNSYPHNFNKFATSVIWTNYIRVDDKVRNLLLADDVAPIIDKLRNRLQREIVSANDVGRLKKYAEAPPDAPLGYIAFSPNRIDNVPKFEKDTETEAALYDALHAHIIEGEPLGEDDVAVIRALMRSGQYQKIFKAPEVKMIYRGMAIGAPWLRKILGLGPQEKIPAKGSQNVDFTYRPRQGAASSWSRSKTAARAFFGDEGDYIIVLTADVDKNEGNLLDASGIYKVDPMDVNSNEREVVGLQGVNVSKIEWTYRG